MSNQFENPAKEKLVDPKIAESPVKKLDKVADKAAEQGAKTEQRYDKDHTIFSN
jgi:hypothetical protein